MREIFGWVFFAVFIACLSLFVIFSEILETKHGMQPTQMIQRIESLEKSVYGKTSYPEF